MPEHVRWLRSRRERWTKNDPVVPVLVAGSARFGTILSFGSGPSPGVQFRVLRRSVRSVSYTIDRDPRRLAIARWSAVDASRL